MNRALSPSSRRNHDAGNGEVVTSETLLRDASRLLEATGVSRSASWLSRTVRSYLEASVRGMPFGVYLFARVELNDRQRTRLAERADLRYLLTYADPTGEVASRHVARERGEDW